MGGLYGVRHYWSGEVVCEEPLGKELLLATVTERSEGGKRKRLVSLNTGVLRTRVGSRRSNGGLSQRNVISTYNCGIGVVSRA